MMNVKYRVRANLRDQPHDWTASCSQCHGSPPPGRLGLRVNARGGTGHCHGKATAVPVTSGTVPVQHHESKHGRHGH